MSFFPPDPDMPEIEDDEPVIEPRWQAPEDELPTLLPVSQIIAATDYVAIALVGVSVYSSGVKLRLKRYLRRHDLSPRDWNEVSNLFMEYGVMGASPDPGGRLRFGLVLADGTKILADPGHGFFGAQEPHPEEITVMHQHGGGGGGSRQYTQSDGLWLWPTPPDGPIELVLQWPSLGIAETHITIDGSRLSALAQQATPLWEKP